VDLKGIDSKVLDKVSEDGYFTKDKAAHKPGEDAFFKQGEKPEVRRMELVHKEGTDKRNRRRRLQRTALRTRSRSTRRFWPPSRRRLTSPTT
jgi:hypothetical protein